MLEKNFPLLTLLTMTILAFALPARAWVEGFESIAPGGLPAGWELLASSRAEGWTARVATGNAAAGRHCLEVSLAKPPSQQWTASAGIVRQAFDASPYRGKTMRLAGQVRVHKDESANGWAIIRIQARRNSGAVLAHQTSGDRRTSSPEWARQVIALQVPGEADTIEVGITIAGAGTAWLDELQFEDSSLDPARWNAPPSKLSERSMENLVALARLYGIVRFFHPSDEASATNWADFLLAAVDRVEAAPAAADLRERLHEVFRPIAPALELGPTAFEAVLDAGRLAPPSGSRRDYTLWKHQGYGVEQVMSSYTTRRLVANGLHSLLDKDLHEAPRPGAAAVSELASEVFARVPLVLCTIEGRTWPRAPGTLQRLEIPEEWSPNAADRRTRLAGVIIAWSAFQHFYPYFDVVQVDWDAALRQALAAAALDADRDAYLRTLRRFTALTRDGHVRVSHSFEDRPFLLPLAWDWAEGQLVITRVEEGGPADALRAGEVVESLGGRAIEDWVAETRPQIAAASEGWMRWRLLGEFSRWPDTDPVRVGVRDAAGELRTVSLAPVFREWPNRTREARPANGSELAPGVAYFNLDGADAPELEAALPQLSAARVVVLDLRGYPRRAGTLILEHLARERMTSAFWNIPQLFEPDRRNVRFVTRGRWSMKPREPHIPAAGGKAIFVTDGSAISYAESCLGIVEAYSMGAIVGQATAGTNGNVASIRLPGGFRISFTGMQVLKHDGTPHHGVGIHPTVPAVRTIGGIAAGRDELLEKAIEIARRP